MNQNKINDLLNKINSKSKKKWNLDDIKSLAKNFSKNDLKNEHNMNDLITKVAKAAGVKLVVRQTLACFRKIDILVLNQGVQFSQ